ncbi:MAG: hypothetical protein GY809_30800 [Planctomycetes bacterium]|nr:hypothetical protein [Planctomycetota bacterium]
MLLVLEKANKINSMVRILPHCNPNLFGFSHVAGSSEVGRAVREDEILLIGGFSWVV